MTNEIKLHNQRMNLATIVLYIDRNQTANPGQEKPEKWFTRIRHSDVAGLFAIRTGPTYAFAFMFVRILCNVKAKKVITVPTTPILF